MNSKTHIRKKLLVRIAYNDGSNEIVPMLTWEFYRFITRFNKEKSNILSFKVEKLKEI